MCEFLVHLISVEIFEFIGGEIHFGISEGLVHRAR